MIRRTSVRTVPSTSGLIVATDTAGDSHLE